MAEIDERGSIGSLGQSMSSGSLRSSNSGSSSTVSLKTALNECSAAWQAYLNILNGLCAAGSRLAHAIAVLEQCGHGSDSSKATRERNNALQNHPTTYLTNSWTDLARATTVATNTVKTHIMGVLQDFITLSNYVEVGAGGASNACEMEQIRMRDHNELIILENAQTLMNVQHQFCAASCNAFSTLTCCLVCQAPVGFSHENDCSMLQQNPNTNEQQQQQQQQQLQRSQTPSPHFHGSALRAETQRNNAWSASASASASDSRPFALGAIGEPVPLPVYNLEMPCRGPSPQQVRETNIPLQTLFEQTRGPLPNPGLLLSMKMPFYRDAISPLNFPLFPLNGQRRWSEAAAGEVGVNYAASADAECQMRRWSMPWEASKTTTNQNMVTWYQTRMMPKRNSSKFVSSKPSISERGSANTQDSNWHSSISSNDGLMDAIQLLSCRPNHSHQPTSTHNLQQQQQQQQQSQPQQQSYFFPEYEGEE